MVNIIVALIAGLVLLVFGAEFFVRRAARMAKRLGMSELLIGLTLVAVGTSLPELAASLAASLQGIDGLVTGNIVGSNIANIGLIIGIAAAIRSLKISKQTFFRDIPLFMASVVLFLWFSLDGVFSRLDGVILLTVFVLYTLFLVHTSRRRNGQRFRHFLEFAFRPRKIWGLFNGVPKKRLRTSPSTLLLDIGILVLTGCAVVLGARLLVDGAIGIAQALALPSSIIGLSIVAIGTSLPELAVSIQAARKKLGDMVVGNVIGSNIANILLVLGASAAINPLAVPEVSILYTIPLLAFFSLALVIAMRYRWAVGRFAGLFLLCTYVLFMVVAFILGWA